VSELNVKVGDEVIVRETCGSYWGPVILRRAKVSHISKAIIRLEGYQTDFNRNGYRRGAGRYTYPCLENFDQARWDENQAAHKERNDRARLKAVKWDCLSIEQVRSVLALIDGFDK